ncbi:MAG: AbrB/MazE/SpoVT family DNA-binding domain-containing protein [Balneolaceae bacterium]
MKKEATVTSKGQITIPAEIRKRFKLQAQDKVRFETKGDRVILRPVRREDLLAVYNSVSAKGKETDIHTIREETQKAIGEQAAKEGT